MMRQETQLLTYPITGNPITYLPNYLQGIRGGQDLKGQPPNRHLEVLNQWNIQGRSYMAAVCPAFLLCLALSLYEIGRVREPQDGGGHRTAGHGLQWQGRGPSLEEHRWLYNSSIGHFKWVVIDNVMAYINWMQVDSNPVIWIV